MLRAKKIRALEFIVKVKNLLAFLFWLLLGLWFLRYIYWYHFNDEQFWNFIDGLGIVD